jgi:uncharacterized membrane protein
MLSKTVRSVRRGRLVCVTTIGLALTVTAVMAPAAGASGRYCGTTRGLDVVAVGPTSCSFARRVTQAYLDVPWSNGYLRARSPVTGKRYWMHCRLHSRHYAVCTGGNRARVEIRS